MFENNKNRKRLLGSKFKEAGSSGNKVHVMSREGHWVVFREGAERASSQHTSRQSAIQSGQKIMESKSADSLIVHNIDGSVDKIL